MSSVSALTRVKLRLYGGLSAATGANVPASVYPVAGTAWTESGTGSITWHTKPVSGTTALAPTTITDNVVRAYEWDITAYVQGEKAANRNLVSLVVKSGAASTPYVTFASKEATAGNRPQLLVTSTGARNALFVTASATLNPSESAIQTRLQGLGFTVTVKAASSSTAVTTADANGKALVVISSTVAPANVLAKFRDVPVPVIDWESDILDDMGMTGAAAGTDFGTLTAQTNINIVTPGHPLAAGLSGSTPVVGAASSFTWGKPNANAFRVATLNGDATKYVIFGYEVGAAMPGLPAPARRVALFLSDATAAGLNAGGWSLFDAAVKWAADTPVAPTLNSLTPAAGPVGTSVTINGYNFGGTQGTSTLTFNGLAAVPTAWSANRIVAPVPAGATTGAVVLTVNGLAGNGLTFTVEIPPADTDGDGLPDAWEMQYFGNLGQTAGGDPDGDGLTNLQEYQQGRNPTKVAQPDDGNGVNLKVHTPLIPPSQ